MEVIDRYVHAVGEHLPTKMRADVEAELRSLLVESLEERAGGNADAASEALAREVIRGFGRPSEVAARYTSGPRYLIGPPLFPVYLTVVKIQVAVIAGVSLFMLVTGRYLRPDEAGSLAVVARAGGSVLGAVVDNIGITTLVFALIEVAIRGRTGGDATWDPSQLPPVDDPDRVSYLGRIVALYLVAMVAAVFNLFPNWVGILVVNDGGAHVVHLLEPGFARYLPFLNGWWAVAFVFNVVLLLHGRWRRSTRWWEVGLDLGLVAIFAAIVLGPPVFHYDRYVKLVMAVAFAVTAVQAGVRAYRLLRAAPRIEPWQAASAK